jgi:hypothetical protein
MLRFDKNKDREESQGGIMKFTAIPALSAKAPPLCAFLLAAVVAAAPAQADRSHERPPRPIPCEDLAKLRLPYTTITVAAMVPAGTFDPPGATPPIGTTACRVAGSIRPTSDSDIQFEVWMPASGWNGKFLSAGEGGYAGAINYGGIAAALSRGYAGGSTDTGHVGGNADFAPGHPEKVDPGVVRRRLEPLARRAPERSERGAPA